MSSQATRQRRQRSAEQSLQSVIVGLQNRIEDLEGQLDASIKATIAAERKAEEHKSQWSKAQHQVTDLSVELSDLRKKLYDPEDE